MDLSNEVLHIDFGQEAAKVQQVKIGGQKDICPSALFKVGQVGRYSFQPPIFTSDTFVP